jgi:hypothetical protein
MVRIYNRIERTIHKTNKEQLNLRSNHESIGRDDSRGKSLRLGIGPGSHKQK